MVNKAKLKDIPLHLLYYHYVTDVAEENSTLNDFLKWAHVKKEERSDFLIAAIFKQYKEFIKKIKEQE